VQSKALNGLLRRNPDCDAGLRPFTDRDEMQITAMRSSWIHAQTRTQVGLSEGIAGAPLIAVVSLPDRRMARTATRVRHVRGRGATTHVAHEQARHGGLHLHACASAKVERCRSHKWSLSLVAFMCLIVYLQSTAVLSWMVP